MKKKPPAKPVQLYGKIADLITQARQSAVRSINYAMVYTYFEIGRMIVEDEQQGEKRANYGAQTLKAVSKKLTRKFGKGFSVDNLQNMRNFYAVYSTSRIYETVSRILPETKRIDPAMSTKSSISETPSRILTKGNIKFVLSWSHYLFLTQIADDNERRFYEIESANNNWGVRELKRQFSSGLYLRLALNRNKKKIKELSVKGQIIERPEDMIKDPYILEFTGLPENSSYYETDLEQKLIDKMQDFLLELGNGFTFVGRQVRLTYREEHYSVDLVFYNRLLRCFVIVDLKTGKLTHQDIGQMQMYVNYYDRQIKLPDENKTIGILICREKNQAVIEMTLPKDNNTIFASQYKTVLPSKAALKKLLEDRESGGKAGKAKK